MSAITVHDLPPRHHCPGLWDCNDHPRWRITVDGKTLRVARRSYWWAIPPGDERLDGTDSFATHAAAVAYATSQARPRCQWCGDRLTWLGGDVWEGDHHDQCPDSQDGPADDHGNVVHAPRPDDLAALSNGDTR